MKKILSWLIVVGVFFFGVFGILALAQSGDEVSEEKRATHVIKDVRGRQVRVPKKVSRVYYPYYYQNLLSVAGPNAFEKVVASSIYDTANYSDVLYDLLKKRSPGFNQVEDVGTTLKGNFDLEKLIALNPDLVILANYQYEAIGQANIEHLENLNIPVVFIDYTDLSPEAHYRSTNILGQIFGTKTRAKELNYQYQTHLQVVQERLKKVKTEKTVYIEQRSTGSSFAEYGKAYGDQMLMGTLAKKAGADNIYAGKIKTTGDVNPEYLFQKNPDVLFIDGTNYSDPQSVSVKVGYGISRQQTQQTLTSLINERPGFKNLKAVKTGQVYALDNHIMRTMKDYVLVEYMAKSMYPELFKDIDPKRNLKDFNQKYLPNLADNDSFLAQWQKAN